MGFDLRRKDDGMSISIFTWIRACALAIEGGWEQLGTLPPAHWQDEEEAWPGTYDSNDGQQVTAEDALAMAAALQAMLPSLDPQKAFDRDSDDPALLWGTRVDAISYFSDPGKRKILELLINFLKGGAFVLD
jgi:hypothetical protein